MVDVVAQYKRYSSVINKRIIDVINSGQYIQGSEVQNFESELSQYLNSKYTISCGNGTDALYIALMALNLKKGSEVIVPTFTFISTVEAVCLLGLKPVFVDIDPNTFLINPELIKNIISNKTKVIIPVHLFGQCCDMIAIKKIAKDYNLYIVEDAAQSIGSKCISNHKSLSKFSGTIGHIGTTSFYPSKNLGAFGDGGAIFTQDLVLAKRIKMITNHGQDKKYVHKIIGLNSRLDAIQASVLSFKLSLLDEFNQKRQQIASKYNKRLQFVNWLQTPCVRDDTDHTYHQYSILLDSKINRKNFQDYLLKHEIPSMIYYPIPLHQQVPYKIYQKDPLPISEKISKQIISLPIHPEMTLTQINFICDVIKKY